MSDRRRRTLLWAALALLGVWGLAVSGWVLARRSRVTAEDVAARLREVNLAQLSGVARAAALRDLADKMNKLTVEERRRARFEGEWDRWFTAMTEEEKGAFIEATLPSGFKQMLNAFEQLPEDKRRQAIERAMRDLQHRRETAGRGETSDGPTREGARQAPPLSPELQRKVVKLGLKAYYAESSAQSKAELAPLLEEMQRLMESGFLFRDRR